MPNSYDLLKTITMALYKPRVGTSLKRDELIEQIKIKHPNLSIKTIDEYLNRLIIEGVVKIDTPNYPDDYYLPQPIINTIDIIIKG